MKIFWLQKISNFEEMLVYIRQKIEMVDHTLRKSDDNLAKQALDWNPQALVEQEGQLKLGVEPSEGKQKMQEKLGYKLRV